MNTFDTYPCDDVKTEYGIFNGGYLIFQFDHVGPLTISFSCHVTDASTLFVRSFLSGLRSLVQPTGFGSFVYFSLDPFFAVRTRYYMFAIL